MIAPEIAYCHKTVQILRSKLMFEHIFNSEVSESQFDNSAKHVTGLSFLTIRDLMTFRMCFSTNSGPKWKR